MTALEGAWFLELHIYCTFALGAHSSTNIDLCLGSVQPSGKNSPGSAQKQGRHANSRATTAVAAFLCLDWSCSRSGGQDRAA